MAKLPTDLSGREVRTALERAGFVFRRQKGSHMVLRRENPYALARRIKTWHPGIWHRGHSSD